MYITDPGLILIENHYVSFSELYKFRVLLVRVVSGVR